MNRSKKNDCITVINWAIYKIYWQNAENEINEIRFNDLYKYYSQWVSLITEWCLSQKRISRITTIYQKYTENVWNTRLLVSFNILWNSIQFTLKKLSRKRISANLLYLVYESGNKTHLRSKSTISDVPGERLLFSKRLSAIIFRSNRRAILDVTNYSVKNEILNTTRPAPVE